MKNTIMLLLANLVTVSLSMHSYNSLGGVWWTLIPVPLAIIGTVFTLVGYIRGRNREV